MQRENQRLRDRVEELERTAARQAGPFRRDADKKVPPDQHKRPGRKKGHPGTYRQVPDHIEEMVKMPLNAGSQCGGQVIDCQRLEQYIEEIPPVRPHVTRLITYRGCSPQCGHVRTTCPLQTSEGQGAAKVQLGPRALSLTADLKKSNNLIMRKGCKVLQQLVRLTITPGGLAQALSRVAERVKGEYDKLKDEIRSSRVVFADVTSWWVGGPGWWLWTFTISQATLYTMDQSRGSKVVQQVLGEDYAGMLVSDCLASYDPSTYRKHKCIAYHQRAIKEALKDPMTTDRSYLEQWQNFFKTVTVSRRAARGGR